MQHGDQELSLSPTVLQRQNELQGALIHCKVLYDTVSYTVIYEV